MIVGFKVNILPIVQIIFGRIEPSLFFQSVFFVFFAYPNLVRNSFEHIVLKIVHSFGVLVVEAVLELGEPVFLGRNRVQQVLAMDEALFVFVLLPSDFFALDQFFDNFTAFGLWGYL